MKKIGCIGIGNMGGAVCSAICRKISGENVLVCDADPVKTADFQEKYGCKPADSCTLADNADCIVLGIKPQYMASVLDEIREVLAKRVDAGERVVLITMAAGLTTVWFRETLGLEIPVIRIMPNIPVSVGQGMIMYTCTADVTAEEKAAFLEILSLAGTLDELPENLIDAGTAVSGCGPAFLCLVLEAMADGGVACGLPRQKALQYAAQTMIGTAETLLETGKHPGVFKDEVTSPGGSTIAGVKAMEDGGVRAAMMEAVMAAYRRNLELGKK